MKLFKKALVATALLSTFGAHAVSIAPVAGKENKLSSEGVAAGNQATNAGVAFNVIVAKDHPAASKITLTFDSKVDLDDLAAAVGGAVTNDPKEGTGTSGDIVFEYGTGSFTFDNVEVNTKTKGAHFISFNVDIGNPLTANSAFRVHLDGNADITDKIGKIEISGASTVKFDSEDAAAAPIESGSGVLATEESQFSFVNKQELTKLIKRTNDSQYTDGTTTDTAIFTMSNNEDLLANLTAPTYELVLSGNFEGVDPTTGTKEEVKVTAATSVAAVNITAINGDEDELTITLANNETPTDGTKQDVTIVFNHGENGNAAVIPVTGDVDAKLIVKSADLSSDLTFASLVDSGEWALNATIINVPYFPVGYAGLSSSVHFANESKSKAAVSITAIDEANPGTVYEGVLADLEARAVTRVKQKDIMEALNLDVDMSHKLSVTFNIDADVGDVNAYAFSNATTDGARQALVTSQQKGSDK